MPQRRRQRERQKGNRFKRIGKATTLHAFLNIFLAITARPGQDNAKFHILLRT